MRTTTTLTKLRLEQTWLERMLSILEEAVSGRRDDAPFGADAECRQRIIDLMESLGYIQVREGDPAEKALTDSLIIDAITSLGRIKREELRRQLGRNEQRA